MINYLNTIKTYDEMLYESRPVSLNEFLTDKYNNIHNELYNDALSKYLNEFISKKIITKKFVYELYKNMINTFNSFDNFYDNINLLDDDAYIKKILKLLKGNDKDFLKSIFNITIDSLKTLKEYIISKNIIKGIELISDINDFTLLREIDNMTVLESEDGSNTYLFESYRIEIDSDYNTIQLIDKDTIESELEDYIFILEEETGVRIGYNENGEWILILGKENKFKTINDIIDELQQNLTYNEISNLNKNLLNSKEELVKKINKNSNNLINIYKNIALYEFKSYHKIIEIKNSEYWMPSSIYIISNIRPYKKEVIDLTKYWNMYQSLKDINISDLKYTCDSILDSELIYLNYVNGTAKMRSKSNDLEYEIPFKYLDEDTNVSEEMKLNKTFIYKYNNR